jgi:hypothetical protein
MEDQLDRSSAVTMPVKVGRLGKSDIRSQNKRTIYNVYKFFKDISEEPEHFSNINFHKTQEITAKACGVHCSTVQKVCNEASILRQTIKYLLFPGNYTKENMMLQT